MDHNLHDLEELLVVIEMEYPPPLPLQEEREMIMGYNMYVL